MAKHIRNSINMKFIPCKYTIFKVISESLQEQKTTLHANVIQKESFNIRMS